MTKFAKEISSQAAQRNYVTVVDTGFGLKQEIIAGRHRLVADEPVEAGGGDQGPTPYDLLLSALGACTSITIRIYAQRKGWALDGVTVHLSHTKIHAEDCRECETEAGQLDQIDCEIELAGSITPDQRLRLLQIAEKCPIHRTLTSEIEILTTMK